MRNGTPFVRKVPLSEFTLTGYTTENYVEIQYKDMLFWMSMEDFIIIVFSLEELRD